MEIYLVGGAVRDFLLHRPIADQDWVVVGANPQQMLDLGFLPVGKDFPVFLHPTTRQEYALARTERKTGGGYKGFAIHSHPDVTLEQDLERRDLTINAMAIAQKELPLHADNYAHIWNSVIDPFHGRNDLRNKVLRHVGPAFQEDPVRILRLARFAARYYDFTVATETLSLMQSMVQQGEIHYLVVERIWQEIAKGLTEVKPSRMMQLLHDCGALNLLILDWDALWHQPHRLAFALSLIDSVSNYLATPNSKQLTSSSNLQLSVSFTCWTLACCDFPLSWPLNIADTKLLQENASFRVLQAKKIADTLKVPLECKDLSVLVTRELPLLLAFDELTSDEILDLLERLDAFRKPQRFQNVLTCTEIFSQQLAKINPTSSLKWNRTTLEQAFDICSQIDTLKIASHAIESGLSGIQIGIEIKKVRQKSLFSKLKIKKNLA